MTHPIGHSSPSFCHDPVAKTAQQMAEAKFDVWEIVGEGLHSPQAHLKEFLAVLPSYSFQVQLHAPISDVNLGSLYPAAWELSLETVKASLIAAAQIGVTRATIHPGNHTPLSRDHYGKLHEASRKALRRLDDVGNEHGLELCLENMPTGWAFETDSLEKLLDLTQGTEFRLCLDLGHAHVAKRIDEFLGRPQAIRNVHIHDNKGDVDAHLTLGEGTVPWQDAARRLVSGGYAGPFIVESKNHTSGRASQARLQETLRVFA